MITLLILLGFVLFGHSEAESLMGYEAVGIVTLALIMVLYVFLKFACRLYPLDREKAARQATLKNSRWVGGPVTPRKFFIAVGTGATVAVVHAHYYEHISWSIILPPTLFACGMIVYIWKAKFRR